MVPGAHAGPGVVLVPVELTSKEEGSGRDARDRTGCDAVRPRARARAPRLVLGGGRRGAVGLARATATTVVGERLKPRE